MSRALGRDHHHVHVGGRNDGLEMNAEAVRDAENFSGMQIGLDELLVDLRLGLVGSENLDPVGALGGLVGSHHDHAVGPRLLGALASRVEPNDDFVSAVAKILRLRVSLAAIADDGDRLALQCLGLRVAFIKNSNHQRAPLDHKGRKEALACWGKSVFTAIPTGRSVSANATCRGPRVSSEKSGTRAEGFGVPVRTKTGRNSPYF